MLRSERCENRVDLVKSFPTSICLQTWASIQPRTSLSKFGGDSIHFSMHCLGEKYLLSRAASVSNLGDRYFQLDFNKALQAYELEEEGKTKANKACFQVDPGDPNCLFTGLKSQTPVQLSGAPTTPPAPGLVFQTTYLSERLWIVRNEQGDKVGPMQFDLFHLRCYTAQHSFGFL